MGSVNMIKPIFCIAHPRACSTAFERVFMTRTEDLACIHEPFGDAFYFGPERMGARYEQDETARLKSGFAESTYKTILDRIESEGREGKRVFVKDISYYFVPPNGQEATIAPSLHPKRRGIGTEDKATLSNGSLESGSAPFPYQTGGEPGNPTVLPAEIWKKFHITFLIRDPHNSISSFYRCTVPPINKITDWHDFDPSEMGYVEQRRILDYLVAKGHVGPKRAGAASEHMNGHVNGANGADNNSEAELCVVDADDLLDNPEGIMEVYCQSVNLDYHPSMLNWDSEESHQQARTAFQKWRGWHDDAIESRDLKPRPAHKKKQRTEEQWDAEWKAKYGEDGAKIIRKTVDANMADYLYLKQFAMKV